jgi:hypothetical protein
MKKRALHGVLVLFLVSCFAVGTASAVTVVVPNSMAILEGDGVNAFPFNISARFPPIPSMRYQQVFQSSEFSAFGGPALITQIAFRPDAVFGNAFSSFLPSVRIDISTTSAAPDTLSSTFASNVGADDRTVYSGSLPLSSAFTGFAGGPKTFDIVINLATPFFYNPAAGNLLLDVRNFGGGSTTFFDAQIASERSYLRAFSTVTGSVDDPSGDADSTGLVTRFTGSPVPMLSCVGFENSTNNGRGNAKNIKVLQLKADLVNPDGNIAIGTDIISPPVLHVVMVETGGSTAIDVTNGAESAGRGTAGKQFVFTSGGEWQFNLMTRNYSTPGTYTVSILTGNIFEYIIQPTCTATFVIE